jgi:hypothetical protein
VKDIDGVAIDDVHVAGLNRLGNGWRGERQECRQPPSAHATLLRLRCRPARYRGALVSTAQWTHKTGFIAPCLPTKAHTLPSGGLWLHEIKHNGFRIVARKDGERVRLYSRPGNDLTRRFHADRRDIGSLALALLHYRRRSCRLR